MITGEPGNWPTIESFLEKLLVSDKIDQRPYFFGWLNSARAAMLNRMHAPGQLLGLAGPRGCGKTQVIGIIEKCMGGRRANPREYFTGGRFNADLIAAELLVLDDEDMPAKETARQAFPGVVSDAEFGAWKRTVSSEILRRGRRAIQR